MKLKVIVYETKFISEILVAMYTILYKSLEKIIDETYTW